jgi:hypothetical protein
VLSKGDRPISVGSSRNTALIVAAAALVAGIVLALTSGDPLGIVVLALGALGGWAAGRAAAAHPGGASDTAPALASAPHTVCGPEPEQSGEALRPPMPVPARPGAGASWDRGEAPSGETSERVQRSAAGVQAPVAVDAAAVQTAQASAVAGAAQMPADEPPAALAPAAIEERAALAEEEHAQELVAVGAAGQSVGAAESATNPPDAPHESGGPAAGAAPAGAARGSAATPQDVVAPEPPSQEIDSPLPTEARLQDLAARQRSATADLRRAITSRIERLEDEEPPPPPRRRGKKSRR